MAALCALLQTGKLTCFPGGQRFSKVVAPGLFSPRLARGQIRNQTLTDRIILGHIGQFVSGPVTGHQSQLQLLFLT